MSLSGYVTTQHQPHPVVVLQRIPLVLFWNWTNILLFNIANQRLVGAVVEDRVNKPWRPLPSKRVSETQARHLLLLVIPIVLGTGYTLRCEPETLLLITMTWMYNDLGGADDDYVIKNLLNAFGITCYGSASTLIACGQDRQHLSHDAHVWLAVGWGIIFTTVQIQDLADMAGDASRGRRTLPLVYGETVTRLSVSFSVIGWSTICPTFWNVRNIGSILCLMMGGLFSFRTYFCRGVPQDKMNFKIWSVWIIVLYLLPLLKRLGF
jgi:4-hydroxybenzoate polyprenyltransferase